MTVLLFFKDLKEPNPKPRYLVGNKEEAIYVVEKIMSTLQQINQGHEHSLSRQELIEILERYLADEREQP